MHSYWIQLKLYEQLASGIRLKDMPDEWFEIPSEKSMKNSMTATMSVFACCRLMDEMKFDIYRTDQTTKKLLEIDTGMMGPELHLLVINQIYCELIRENRQDILDNILDKEQKAFMKSMKDTPSVMRTEYAYALFAEKNDDKATQIKAQFDKISKEYPYQGEIASERELIANADNLIKILKDNL